MAYLIKNVGEEILEISNVIPESYQENIISKIQGINHFPWFSLHKIGHPDFFSKGESVPYTDTNITDEVGFFHMVFDGKNFSPFFDFFYPILTFLEEKVSIKVKNLLRIRIRYTHPCSNHSLSKYAPPHVDYPSSNPYYTLIYYVEDSDGDTILFDKFYDETQEYNPLEDYKFKELYRFTPKQGSAIFFNGHRYHSGNYPVNYSSRIVINFDFEI
jgi:hypothetical protein